MLQRDDSRNALRVRCWLCGVVLFLLVPWSLFAQQQASTSSEQLLRLDHGWEFRLLAPAGQTPEVLTERELSGNWQQLGRLTPADLDGKHDVLLRVRLPHFDRALNYFVAAYASTFAIYADGTRVYDFLDSSAVSSRRVAANSWHLAEIPPSASDGYLFIYGPRAHWQSIGLVQSVLAPPSAFPAFVWRYLREPVAENLPEIVCGSLLAGVGLFAAVLSFLRGRRGDLLLFSFGLFSFLYGLRLLIGAETIRLSLQGDPLHWSYASAFITYVIPVPLMLFWRESLKGRVRQLANASLIVIAVFSAGAIAHDLAIRTPASAMTVNNILVIVWTALLLPALLQSGGETRTGKWVLRAGLVVFIIFALNENLVGLRLVPWQWHREFIGFFAFACCLAYVAAVRFFENEAHFAELRKEMETAQQIQVSILPREFPRLDGLALAVRYEPMRMVAGDFYDFIRVDDHRLGVLVADVSGHGVPAALIASMLKVAFTSHAQHAGRPAAMLSALNRTFHGQLDGQFITAAYLYLDLVRRECLYASAGHPPMLLLRGGEAREIKESGLILGPFPEACYSDARVEVVQHDRLVLYTDGIVEAANRAGECFGDAALKRLLESHASSSAPHFADAAVRAVRTWSRRRTSAEQDDDQTLAVIDIL